MEELNLTIALIAAGSALLGSLIPTVVNYFLNRQQNKFELNKELIAKQKEIYGELINTLQEFINNTQNDQFLNLQKAGLKVAMFGDNVTSQAFNSYYRELVRFAQGARQQLTQEEHVDYQSRIINGIRNHFGLNEFDQFEFVRFSPQP